MKTLVTTAIGKLLRTAFSSDGSQLAPGSIIGVVLQGLAAAVVNTREGFGWPWNHFRPASAARAAICSAAPTAAPWSPSPPQPTAICPLCYQNFAAVGCGGEGTMFGKRESHEPDGALVFRATFCSHPDPVVRAAAIEGLCLADAGEAEKLLPTALNDPESRVRIAAARSLREILNGLRSTARGAVFDAWLEGFHTGSGRPAWMAGRIGEIEQMLLAETREERLAASLTLVALGRATTALPVLREAVRTEPSAPELAAPALPWLPWEQRESFYGELLALRPHADPLSQIIESLATVRDERAIPPLWRVLADPEQAALVADRAADVLKSLYLGDHHQDVASILLADRKRTIAEAEEQARSGSEWQRVVALVLLASVSPEDAAASARNILADTGAGDALRQSALKCVFLCDAAAASHILAAEILAQPDAAMRRLALIYLARGDEAFWQFGGGINFFAGVRMQRFGAATAAPDLAAYLNPEILQPLVSDSDAEVAAYAGYLLSQLGEPDGMAPLLRFFREHTAGDASIAKLVSSAIAAVDDDAQVPLLEEIYNQFDLERSYEVREFYWTIRVMTGPEAFRLRKRIRDEVGIQNLQ